MARFENASLNGGATHTRIGFQADSLIIAGDWKEQVMGSRRWDIIVMSAMRRVVCASELVDGEETDIE